MSQIDYAKKFKINAVDRYMKTFANIARYKLFNIKEHGRVNIFAAQHFSERLVDRHLGHEFAVKLLSYAFEKHANKFIATVDTFINYKDIILVVNSEKHEDVCKIRLKTMLTKGEDTFLNSKNNIPT